MVKIMSIINQKGGVGKTTTAEAITAGLNLKGYKVLAIDLDAQCNLSYTAGADTDGITITDVLTKDVTAREAIQHLPRGDIMPASRALTGADTFIKDTGKEYRLKEVLEPIKKEYQYIILDTPPALGILTVNALTASDSVIIPAQADIYSLQGIRQLWDTIQPVKKYCNSELYIEGILLTRYNGRTILSRDIKDMLERLARTLETRVFKTTIREAVTVKEAQINQQSLFDYAPKAKVTEDYKNLIKELCTTHNV